MWRRNLSFTPSTVTAFSSGPAVSDVLGVGGVPLSSSSGPGIRSLVSGPVDRVSRTTRVALWDPGGAPLTSFRRAPGTLDPRGESPRAEAPGVGPEPRGKRKTRAPAGPRPMGRLPSCPNASRARLAADVDGPRDVDASRASSPRESGWALEGACRSRRGRSSTELCYGSSGPPGVLLAPCRRSRRPYCRSEPVRSCPVLFTGRGRRGYGYGHYDGFPSLYSFSRWLRGPSLRGRNSCQLVYG